MATQTLLTTATTFVSSTLADVSLSFSAIIVVGTDSIYGTSISFMNFDLSSIPVQSVDSAVLRLFPFAKTGAVPSPIVVNRVTSDFDIATVTYNTMPTFVPTGFTTEVSNDELLQFIEIDITGLVNQWLNGTFPNFGLALTNPDGTTSVQFGGKPIGAAFEPQLVVTFTPVSPGNLEGIQVQLLGSPGTIIGDGDNIIFDTVINDQSGSISYDPTTGEFTISEACNYYVKWWVTTDGSAGPVNMVFSIFVDGSSFAQGNSPIVTGQVDGDAFVTVSGSPVTVTLVNETGADVLFANIPVQADITIFTAN